MTRTEQLMSAVRQAQFPHPDSLIHLFVDGSELHGAKVKNTDDSDIYGIYLDAARTCARVGQAGLLCLEYRWR